MFVDLWKGTQLKELGCGFLVHFVINANYTSLSLSPKHYKNQGKHYKQQK